MLVLVEVPLEVPVVLVLEVKADKKPAKVVVL